MRGVALIIVAAVLGACQTRDPYVTDSGHATSGNWKIDRKVDRVTGVTVPSATLIAMSSNSVAEKPRPAMLQLTCFDKQPLLRFEFEFKIGSDRNSILGYRFDDKPGRDNVESRVLQGYKVVVIEEKADVARFASDLRDSKVLYLRIRSLNAGRTTAEFKLDGSAAAIEAGFAGCPVPGAPPPKRTS